MTSLLSGDAMAGANRLESPSPGRPTAPRERPTVVCMTPVKDEAWILERFLACASLWADHIIVADQGSTDGSREIAEAHPKVHLIRNEKGSYGEAERQRLLIGAARELVDGPRFLVALDADEAFTANVLDSPEWQRALEAPPGTVFNFQWVNLADDMEHCWIPGWEWSWGYMDDGAAHVGLPIHSPRVPVPPGAHKRRMRDVKVLHFAHTDMGRVASRNRWYQCWETLHTGARTPVEHYRQYHQFGDADRMRRIEPAWLDGYRRAGVDVTSVEVEGRYRWDDLVLAMLREHGAAPFRRLDIWDVNWRALAAERGEPTDGIPDDPRTLVDRLVFKYLRRTNGRHVRFPFARIDRALKRLGW